MSKEIGPREKALREQREAKWQELQDAQRANRGKEIAALKGRVALASQKRGKPRKAKK